MRTRDEPQQEQPEQPQESSYLAQFLSSQAGDSDPLPGSSPYDSFGADGAVRGQGELPAGTYTLVEVRFDGGATIFPGWPVAIGEGDEVVIRCDARFETCRQP